MRVALGAELVQRVQHDDQRAALRYEPEEALGGPRQLLGVFRNRVRVLSRLLGLRVELRSLALLLPLLLAPLCSASAAQPNSPCISSHRLSRRE